MSIEFRFHYPISHSYLSKAERDRAKRFFFFFKFVNFGLEIGYSHATSTTMFENYSNGVFQFFHYGIFQHFFVQLKVTCLVTLFESML